MKGKFGDYKNKSVEKLCPRGKERNGQKLEGAVELRKDCLTSLLSFRNEL